MKHIHFVGIKGVGMAPLAILSKQAGFFVTGSDLIDEFITDEPLKKSGIKLFNGFSKDNISNNINLVITTGAHGGQNNIEVKTARQMNIPVLSQGQAVGEFMKGNLFGKFWKGVSIAGCHGKTTTTAMIATVLKTAGMDPSYVIGTSIISSLGFSGNFGKGDWFIAEADEYATDPVFDKTAKFLWQSPEILAITNIDFDHPDIYSSLADVQKVYSKFVNNLKENGTLIINGDDPSSRKLLNHFNKKYITYGKNIDNNYYFSDINYSEAKILFTINYNSKKIGKIALYLSGEHNIYNALCSYVVCSTIGLSFEQIKIGLAKYKGSKRRMEYIGMLSSGALIYDDYAHHPTEILKTLEGLRHKYPNKKIVCIFQPHTFSRTKILFDHFKYSFEPADMVIISDIYASKREVLDKDITSKKLAKTIKGSVVYLPRLINIADFIKKQNFENDTILLTMGAGDVYKVWEYLEIKKICKE